MLIAIFKTNDQYMKDIEKPLLVTFGYNNN